MGVLARACAAHPRTPAVVIRSGCTASFVSQHQVLILYSRLCGIYAHLKGVYSRTCITHAHLALYRTRAIYLYALSLNCTLSIVPVFTFDHVPIRSSIVHVHSLPSPTLLVQRLPDFGSLSACLELRNAYRILFMCVVTIRF